MSTFLGDVIAAQTAINTDVTTKVAANSITPTNVGGNMSDVAGLFTDLGWDIDSATPTVISNTKSVMVGSIVGSNTLTDTGAHRVRVAGVTRGQLFADSGNVNLQLYDGTGGKTLTQKPVPFSGSLTANRSLYGMDATGTQPVIVKNVKLAAQTAIGTITTYTLPAVDHTFRIEGYALVSAIATDVISFEVAFTDEAGTPQVIRLSGILAINAPSSAINAVGFWAMNPITIAAQASSTITVRTTLSTGRGTFTSDFRAVITQLD